jgi:cytochrome c-type biogenesis protein CcmH/NrfF
VATNLPGRRLRLGLIAVIGIIVILCTAARLLVAQTQKISVDEVAQGLTCQCGCGLTIANCNHPNCSFSVPAKEQIEAMINRGMGRTAIIAKFRAEYGEKILSAPTTEGFNLLAWITPFAALIAGAGAIVLVLGRWRGRNNMAPAAEGTVAPISPAESELRRRLARELRERI